MFLLMYIVFAVVGVFCLYLAPIKYDWMIEHGMLKHAYTFAALSIFGEVFYLITLRNAGMSLWRIFRDVFGEDK